jgi:hypothetical protein
MARVEQPLVTRSWTTEETKLPFLQAHILFLRNKAKRSEIPEGISGASTSTATSGWMLPAGARSACRRWSSWRTL